jgi:hypothetical protein
MVYWSNTKLADHLRGTSKPDSATSEGWDEWRETAKSKHPFRYWLVEDALDSLQQFITYPLSLYREIGYYIDNRFVTKTHALTSNLERGKFHERDARILHCLFDELVNYVEIDLAFKYSLYNGLKPKGRRNAGMGTAYLAEETALVYNDNWVARDDPKYGKPTPQAIEALEILDLYHWWKSIRPARLDPYVATGWDTLCDEVWEGKTKRDDPEYRERSRKVLDEVCRIEEEQLTEDTEMLIRLIKVRGSLWS